MDKNLSTAWRFFIVEVVVFVCTAFALKQFGYPNEWLLIPLLLFNLLPAIYVAKAARALGKSATLFGVVAALGLPGMFFALTLLRSAAIPVELDREHR
ncbi:4-amino-4-deoxy-L-arabinose transferase-like glycosyltransferase [Lysobacter niastensis]|uniref:4-amino-4-deoxy-L-arabinose transferase-like glycosyltransferase n=1 Tax=Lysobacter niastensis TaxID=380629 RepID=A0ABU1W913_9GAMM|nr:hypothetical protein [Lysobacter niastensis]MDR7134082.1 4-amino-4-deoxy-L-arabinose transferase-like glycosyltransferase [Lysobacter niastensis]